jgi:hypothetical protein
MRSFLIMAFFVIIHFRCIAQTSWKIESYHWENRGEFDKYIKPEQWIGKTIKFTANSIEFDFSGIEQLDKGIDYSLCELLEPLDTFRVTKTKEFMFIENVEKYFAKVDSEIYVIQAKPNCYKFPFRNFIFHEDQGLFRFRGVCFVLSKK